MNDTATPTITDDASSTTTITPDGFRDRGTVGYYARRGTAPTWTQGTLERVADVIGPDWPCLIEVDRQTRHTVVGRLAAVRTDHRQPAGWTLVVEYGETDRRRTAHAGMNIGAITPLPGKSTPSFYDVSRRFHEEHSAATTAWWTHLKAETGGFTWYGRSTLHAAPDGATYLYYESLENTRHDVTRPRKLADGTERKEYTYGPLEAIFYIDRDGNVSERTRREHHDPEILAWRQAVAS